MHAADPQKTLAIYERLTAVYGQPVLHPTGDPLGELVGTILSQNTSDSNSGRAYAALRQRYPSWQAVLDAPTEQVYASIRSAGLGNIKAPRIQRALQSILERCGSFDLDFLAQLPLDEAKRWLTELDGIGPKTAACVLLFALGRPALPVDTHVYRVSQRLGLIGQRTSAEQAHRLLEQALPPAAIYPFHIDMIRHGRRVCQAQRPRCHECPLSDLCAFYSGVGRGA